MTKRIPNLSPNVVLAYSTLVFLGAVIGYAFFHDILKAVGLAGIIAIILGAARYPVITIVALFADYAFTRIFPGSGNPFVLDIVVLLMVWLALFRRRQTQIYISPKVIYVYLLLIITVIQSEFWDNGYNLAQPQRYYYLAIGFLSLFIIQTVRDRWIVFVSYIFTSLSFSLWVLLRANHGEITTANRGFEVMDPNYLSSVIWIGVILLLAIVIRKQLLRWYLRILLIVPILTCIYALSFLTSRGALIAMVIGAVTMLIFRFPNPKTLVLNICILFVAIPMVIRLPVFDGFRTYVASDSTENAGGRTEIWRGIKHNLETADTRRLLLGGGTGYTYVATIGSYGRHGWHSHNAFLELVLDYGLLGLFVFLWLIIIALRNAVYDYKHANSTGIGMLGVMAFLIIDSLSLSPFMYIWGWILLSHALTTVKLPFNSSAVDELCKSAN